MAEKNAIAYDNLEDYHYTAPLVKTLECPSDPHAKSWEGSEQGMLLYRLFEMKSYFESHRGFAEMMQRLQKATKKQKTVQIE